MNSKAMCLKEEPLRFHMKKISCIFGLLICISLPGTVIMEISGKILSILPEQQGEGRNGPWRKQDFIIETQGQYPRKVCISVWGDKIDQFSLKDGEFITASVNIESREFNGRWYTDVKAWKVDREGQEESFAGPDPSMPAGAPPSNDAPMPTDESIPPANEEDDLPF